MKFYKGRIPACGVFCGGCPMYMREERPCQGADLNRSRCEKCKTFHLCCLEKGITHCFQCTDFPCAKFKGFAKRWLKYGQNFVESGISFPHFSQNIFFLLFYLLFIIRMIRNRILFSGSKTTTSSPDHINLHI